MIQGAVAGLIAGGAYALLGVCVVLLFRMAGVLNLAQAAIGTFGAFVMLACYGLDLPIPLAALIGLLAGGLLGAALGAIMSRWFAESPLQTRSSVTIAMLLGVLTLGWRTFGSRPRPSPAFFGGITLNIAGVIVPLNAIVIIVLAIGLGIGLAIFLTHTRIGLQLRALSERPTAADLLGVPSQHLTIGVWAVTGIIASFAIMMIAQMRAAEFSSLSLLIMPALAAALVGVFRSFSITIIGGLGIGLLEGMTSQVVALAPYKLLLWLLIIVAALLWTQRKEVWDAGR